MTQLFDAISLRELDKIILADWTDGDVYPKMIQYLQDKDIKTVVDIGASSGGTAYLLLSFLKPQVIYCFEPDGDNFVLLQKNLGMFNHIYVINKAIYYGKETVKVNGVGDDNFLGYMIADIDKEHSDFWDTLITYPDKTFECIELEYYVCSADLIKIDVEGSEYNIIENSIVVQSARYILLETHNHGREYIEAYLSQHLPEHKIIFTQGIGIHLGFLLEKV